MIIIAIVVAVILVGIGAVQWYAAKSQKDIEQYPYKVLKTYPEFETRAYAPTYLPRYSYRQIHMKKALGVASPYWLDIFLAEMKKMKR